MKVWILAKKEAESSYNNLRFKEAAEKEGIGISFVNPEDFDIISTKQGKSSVYYKGENVKLPDCLIPRMGSGTTYFAHAIIRHLEHLGVLALNSSDSVAMAKDKLATVQQLAANNIPTPKTILAKFPIDMGIIKTKNQLPFIFIRVFIIT